MNEAVLLAYSFEPPRPGPEIIARLHSVEEALFGGVGEENGAPPLRASCGESSGMAYWGPEEAWTVGDGRSRVTLAGLRAERLVSGERMDIIGGPLHGLRSEAALVWSNHPQAIAAFTGEPIEAVTLLGSDGVVGVLSPRPRV